MYCCYAENVFLKMAFVFSSDGLTRRSVEVIKDKTPFFWHIVRGYYSLEMEIPINDIRFDPSISTDREQS